MDERRNPARCASKLRVIRNKIGYPGKWRDYSAVVVERGDFEGNVRRAAAFEFKRALDKIGKPVDRDEWFMTPSTVNAYFNPRMKWACGNTRPEQQREWALTDPHSPAKYRVNGVVVNMPEFAKAFSCKSGAPMTKPAGAVCSIW